MPYQLTATWIMPCNSHKVQVCNTSRRRRTMGLIPSSQTLACKMPIASGAAGAGLGLAAGLGCFAGRGISRQYRARSYAVADTTYFLMVPSSRTFSCLIAIGLQR